MLTVYTTRSTRAGRSTRY